MYDHSTRFGNFKTEISRQNHYSLYASYLSASLPHHPIWIFCFSNWFVRFYYFPFQIGFRWAKLSPPFQVRTRSPFTFTWILTSALFFNFQFVSLLTFFFFLVLEVTVYRAILFWILGSLISDLILWARLYLLFSIIACVYIKLLKLFRMFLGSKCRQNFECRVVNCYYQLFFSL